MPPIRLLIVHNKYGAMSGEEHALENIAQLLEANGHRVSWFLRSSETIHGVKENARAFFAGIHSPSAVKGLRAFLRRQTFDVALVQNLYPFLSPSILSVFREFKIPVLMRCPNYRLFCPNGLHLSHGEICEKCLGGREYWCVFRNCENNLLKSTGYALRNAAARITGRILDNVNLFVVLSEFQRQRFIEGGISSQRLAILPNIAYIDEMFTSDASGELVSFVGRVSPEKGIEDFIAAAARLPEIPFAVAGDLSRMPGLPEKAPKNIRWLGFLQGKELDSFFQQSRILVFPGRWFEGFPNVILRAMAGGKPVIASRLGAIPEIVEHGRTGLLFEAGVSGRLAESIRKLYIDPIKCEMMGKKGQDKAEQQYSQDSVYQHLLRIIARTQVLSQNYKK